MSTVVAQPEGVPTRRCDETSLIEIVELAMHPSAVLQSATANTAVNGERFVASRGACCLELAGNHVVTESSRDMMTYASAI
jgi:hypothetical protein